MTTILAPAVWPFPALRVTCGDVELRYMDDELLHALAAVAAAGVHDPSAMPFTVPWTRGTPQEVARSTLTYHWGTRAGLGGSSWSLELAVLHEGRPVGIQAIAARDYPVTRTVTSGSWLGRTYQGRGIGTRMRLAVLHLAFDGLGAQVACTDAFADNAASNGVTRRIGYLADGQEILEREGLPALSLRYRLERADWDRRPPELRPEVSLDGADAVREFLGG
ncbi:GNAT family N-acetyltransferase [Cellulomonas soli]|uniref:GNAT family N-acetyltransferase n=1 Tax=Cellulomonas soli TaxID=931535 RepID=UPI003F829DCD